MIEYECAYIGDEQNGVEIHKLKLWSVRTAEDVRRFLETVPAGAVLDHESIEGGDLRFETRWGRFAKPA